MKCIDDISNAIDLIEPRCDSNRLMRVKLYAKRGACFLYFDMVKEACSDYKTAALLDPSNKGLIKDFVYLETLIKKNRK
ncbi:hypothetical protein A3Q56_04972 [Intoshia linei]|uniref:Uncharacterized protein n=1 Tax=Intoshia linei TaxID=1819745 RepID=A0A177AZ64_9BILA|nr:hypothetical protein A3Q56_04972 [Intoshia linei]